MKREIALTTLGLLVGGGLGLAVGLHLGARPPPGEPAAIATGPTGTIATSGSRAAVATPDVAEPAGKPAPPSVPEIRAGLDRWLADGAPLDQLPQIHDWLDQWSKTDLRAALRFVADAPRFPQRNAALAIPLATLASRDAAGALAWLTTEIPSSDRKAVAEAIIARIGTEFPLQAMQLAQTPGLSVEPYWMGNLMGSLIRARPQEALSFFARLNHDGRDQAVGPLVSGWYESDRAAAIQWCESQRDTAHFTTAIRALIQSASEQHPGEFDQLVQQLKLTPAQLAEVGQNLDWNSTDQALVILPYLGPEESRRVMSSVIDEQLSLDPAGAIKFARDVLPAGAAADVVSSAWSSWLGSDRKAALAWADTVTDPELRAKIQDTLLTQTAENEPRNFLETMALAPDRKVTPEQIATAVNALGRSDSVAAAKWIAQHPQAVPSSAVGEVTSQWLRQDAVAAFAWVQQLPAGATQDRALRSAVEHWVDSKEFDLATKAIATISDPQRQTAMRMRVFAGLTDQDPAAASRWLETQPVHPEARASWIALMKEFFEKGPGG